MNKQAFSSATLDDHMKALDDKDGLRRQSARESLVALGGVAVTPLMVALGSAKSKQVRWEAAKALGTMGRARSIPALVKALEDSDSDVTWLAADALSTFGKEAWPTLLTALITDGTESVTLRQSAHHVFANQKENGADGLLAPLLAALEAPALPEAASIAAIELLKQVKARS